MRQLDLFGEMLPSEPVVKDFRNGKGAFENKEQDNENDGVKDLHETILSDDLHNIVNSPREETELEITNPFEQHTISTEEVELSKQDDSSISSKDIKEELAGLAKEGESKKSLSAESFVYRDGVIAVKIKKKIEPVSQAIPKAKKEPSIPQKRGRKSFKEMDAESDLIEVPDDDVLFLKKYYPISEVANWFNVNTSLIRFWSNEFDILKPRTNRKGDRMFRPEDVKNLALIYHLLRVRKFSIDGAKDFIKSNKKKADMQFQLTQTLQKFKGFLLELKANLQS